jgi:hypothetical protein
LIALRAACLCALAVNASGTARAEEPCGLLRITQVDMGFGFVDRGATVPMTIDGKKLTLLVDTGGVFSMISDSAAAALGLHPMSIGQSFMAYGGQKVDSYVRASNIEFGGLKAARFDFLVVPATRDPSIDGTLAPDILRAYDVDFDFAGGKFALFSHDHCPGKVVYWSPPGGAAVIPIQIDSDGHIVVPVQLDGKELRAAIDTGPAAL